MKSLQLQKATRAGAVVSLLALALCSALSCSGGKQAKDGSTAMVVAGEKVSERELAEAAEILRGQQMMMGPEKPQASDAELRRGAARGIAGNILMLNEVKAKGWEADSAIVDIMAAQFISRFPSREEFEAQLAAVGESEASMRRGMAEELLMDSLMRTVSAAVPPVDSAEARAHYEANKAIYITPGRISASQIVFAVPPIASDSLVREVMVRANEAHAKAKAGGDFGKLVQEYSSFPKDSDMGWFSQGDLNPGIERALFALKTGDISAPVPSMGGIHIFKKTGSEESRPMAFEEARAGIERSLGMNKRMKAVSDYIEGLIAAADIKFADPALDFRVNATNPGSPAADTAARPES